MITGKNKESLVAELTTRGHQLLSGLPESVGGHDEGPDPHELLEASLAACTILTGNLYAKRKGFKLDSIDVIVKILSEGEETRIQREIEYRGELTLEEKARITEIVGRCPIHRLLESKITIETKQIN